MNRETVHSVKEKSMYRNALQLNTDVKERTNEEGLMNHRKGKKKKRVREIWKHQGLHATEVHKKKYIYIYCSSNVVAINDVRSFNKL